jgi:DNA-binding IclR family transcriptional regulator
MVNLIDRTLDVFELFASERRPLTLSEMARSLKIPVSSCHDLVRSLQQHGYIYELAPRIGYYPTLRIGNAATRIAQGDPFLTRAEIVLREVRDALDEPVYLSKVQGLQATYILALEGSRPLRVMSALGDTVRPIHAKSAGKALLSLLSESELQKYLTTATLDAVNERTITCKERLLEEIELGRKRGWFLNTGETLSGVMSVSVPCKWNSVAYIATVPAPAVRLANRLEETAELLMEACRKLEQVS